MNPSEFLAEIGRRQKELAKPEGVKLQLKSLSRAPGAAQVLSPAIIGHSYQDIISVQDEIAALKPGESIRMSKGKIIKATEDEDREIGVAVTREKSKDYAEQYLNVPQDRLVAWEVACDAAGQMHFWLDPNTKRADGTKLGNKDESYFTSGKFNERKVGYGILTDPISIYAKVTPKNKESPPVQLPSNIMKILASLPGMDHKIFTPRRSRDGTRYYVSHSVMQAGEYNRVIDDNSMSIENKLQNFAQVLTYTNGLHSAGLVHLDLKKENILVDDNGKPMLTDFDTIKEIQPNFMYSSDPQEKLSQVLELLKTGTPQLMSPELLRDKLSILYSVLIEREMDPDVVKESIQNAISDSKNSYCYLASIDQLLEIEGKNRTRSNLTDQEKKDFYYDYISKLDAPVGRSIDDKVDVFALGCILFELWTGEQLVGEKAYKQARDLIVQSKNSTDPELNIQLGKLLDNMLAFNPRQRCTVNYALEQLKQLVPDFTFENSKTENLSDPVEVKNKPEEEITLTTQLIKCWENRSALPELENKISQDNSKHVEFDQGDHVDDATWLNNTEIQRTQLIRDCIQVIKADSNVTSGSATLVLQKTHNAHNTNKLKFEGMIQQLQTLDTQISQAKSLHTNISKFSRSG